MSKLHIRNATANDSTIILRFITDLAIYEKAEHEVIANADSIRASLFGANSTTQAVICELDNQPIGFAVYFFHYSTWLANHGLYLEDLYVDPEQRGIGAGKALLQHLAHMAVVKDCSRFEWSVLDWNKPAINFYDSIGAKPQAEWIRYRLDGEALVEFAGE